jgi:hypothetical protein
MPERQADFDYQFTFTTKFKKKNGEPRNVILKIKDRKDETLNFYAPPFKLGFWIKEHLILFIGIVILILAIIAVLVFVIIRIIKKKRAEQEKMNHRIHSAETENNRNKQEQERIKHEMATREDAQRRAKEAERKKTERESLENKLRSLNRFPRLVGNVNGTQISFELNRIETTIGRVQGNNLILRPSTVSSNHAKIVFDGQDFEIIDTNSTNHVIVNGNEVKIKKLKNMDIIGLGEVILTYFV